jgi:glycosyltransferase involved in cell wall biosynthesis
MRVIMVTKFVPLPDNDGGKQRALAVATRLAQRGDVVLCAYDDGDGDVAGLKRLGIDVRSVPWHPSAARAARGVLRTRSVSAGRFYSPELVDEVRRAAQEGPVDLLQVEYLQMVPVARRVRAARRVLDLHNVESALVRSYARVGRGPAGLLAHAEAAALAAMERSLMPSFDSVVVVSERERQRLPAGVRDVLVCPNGRDPDPLGPPPPASTPTAAFVATLGWAPNVDAALWFGQDVWPEVHRRAPDARLLLVGRDPSPAVRSLASSSVEVSGTVSDVRPYLAQARVAVAPLRSGGGTRLKILEALDAGRPVVATSVAVDGLEDLIGEGVVVADDAGTMIEAVSDLLNDGERATALGRAGHDAVAARHTWDVALAPLLESIVP